MQQTRNQVTFVTQYSIDAIDLRLLEALQRDASRSNLALAAAVGLSAATCLRRVRRLQTLGLIEAQVALLSPQRVADHVGHGLCAIVEVTLDRQDATALDAFEQRAVALEAVQQCYRVSPGPDFCLVVHCLHMPDYAALTQTLFTADANVRNVKTFFSIRRAKFGGRLPLGPAPAEQAHRP